MSGCFLAQLCLFFSEADPYPCLPAPDVPYQFRVPDRGWGRLVLLSGLLLGFRGRSVHASFAVQVRSVGFRSSFVDYISMVSCLGVSRFRAVGCFAGGQMLWQVPHAGVCSFRAFRYEVFVESCFRRY